MHAHFMNMRSSQFAVTSLCLCVVKATCENGKPSKLHPKSQTARLPRFSLAAKRAPSPASASRAPCALASYSSSTDFCACMPMLSPCKATACDASCCMCSVLSFSISAACVAFCSRFCSASSLACLCSFLGRACASSNNLFWSHHHDPTSLLPRSQRAPSPQN